jgi:hypothetical protein
MGSKSRRKKMHHKNRNEANRFYFWGAGCFLLRALGFSCVLDVLYGGQGISKLQFLIKNRCKECLAELFFLNFWIKTLDPDWSRSVSGSWLDPNPDSPEMLDPDPDPQHCFEVRKDYFVELFWLFCKTNFFRVTLFRFEFRNELCREHRNALGMSTFFREITESVPWLFRGTFFLTKFRCQPYPEHLKYLSLT